ncbi:hypothetical protein CALCODRAFT_139154 [Calocera cornea HHB12733]|uniref:Uncharacterized protein n=1 Tax=Calocera cornea HHB12733 TaxID=1353952 RepID=A0A165K3B8_9BASI|nr:hypothetical protein CALCODRAFT_139154 [Calocera cornea HHB12733]
MDWVQGSHKPHVVPLELSVHSLTSGTVHGLAEAMSPVYELALYRCIRPYNCRGLVEGRRRCLSQELAKRQLEHFLLRCIAWIIAIAGIPRAGISRWCYHVPGFSCAQPYAEDLPTCLCSATHGVCVPHELIAPGWLSLPNLVRRYNVSPCRTWPS